MANRPRVAVRVVRADGGPESVIPMRGDVMLCGRNGDLSLADDPFVADTQMRLFFSGNRLAVEDVGGGNGVFARRKGPHPVTSKAAQKTSVNRIRPSLRPARGFRSP